MNVASLELSKELYELSGWETDKWFAFGAEDEITLAEMPDIPQYELGYLLRKLPGDMRWLDYSVRAGKWEMLHDIEANSPEEATAKLCIELFKQGVLKEEKTDE